MASLIITLSSLCLKATTKRFSTMGVIGLKKIVIGYLLYTLAGYFELNINCNPRLPKKQMEIGSMMTDI